mmetsp:Transcript_33719/g.87173  ORF Transcript_33719/g.87173 Transcript_33719/m.87173 type:complete len:210 (-) Transcript_33719:435-1064(-)
MELQRHVERRPDGLHHAREHVHAGVCRRLQPRREHPGRRDLLLHLRLLFRRERGLQHRDGVLHRRLRVAAGAHRRRGGYRGVPEPECHAREIQGAEQSPAHGGPFGRAPHARLCRCHRRPRRGNPGGTRRGPPVLRARRRRRACAAGDLRVVRLEGEEKNARSPDGRLRARGLRRRARDRVWACPPWPGRLAQAGEQLESRGGADACAR